MTAPTAPFGDLSAYVRLPRMSGLVLAPDGDRLVVAVAVPDRKVTRYVTSLWELDPRGAGTARRLTRGTAGESGAAFTVDGDLLFTARREDPERDAAEDEPTTLWLLPRAGGEARVLLSRAGGIDGVLTSRSSTAVLVGGVLPGVLDLETDQRAQNARHKAGVTAILHDGYPVRYWDHDLGPVRPHLLRLDLSGAAGTVEPADPAGARAKAADLTPEARGELEEVEAVLSRDGRLVATSWLQPVGLAEHRSEVHVVMVESGERRVLAADPAAHLSMPRISPDGTQVAYLRETVTSPQQAPVLSVHVVRTGGGEPRQWAEGVELWITGMQWLADGSALIVTADRNGRGPIATVRQDRVDWLTDDDFAYSDLCVTSDGTAVFALRSSYRAAPHPVRIDLDGAGSVGEPVVLPAPADIPELPGTVEDVQASAADGTTIRGWLAIPAGAGADSPAPLLLVVHGGPLASSNAWSWRWNPWLLVARGYAVLLPDPGLSTGYGQEFLQRGWGAWGAEPFTDLMTITDAVAARPDIDQTRTAAMGGSFGGYMANWIAGHTDRFAAVVTHAGLWALEDFGGTTDVAGYWRREMTPEMSRTNSPHLSVDRITTPMLVIHGDKDYRVPIGQGMRLWYDLLASSGAPMAEDGSTMHRFLYFPGENHWVLTPQHAALWYEVVLGFLAEHVLGADPAPVPTQLGGPGGLARTETGVPQDDSPAR